MSDVVPAELDKSGQLQSWENENPNHSSTSREILDNGNTRDEQNVASTIHRSASDANLSSTTDSSIRGDQFEREGIKRVLSETVLSYVDNATDLSSDPGFKAPNASRSPFRRHSNRLTKQSKLPTQKQALVESPNPPELAELSKAHVRTDESSMGTRSKSSTSLSSLARRGSWILGSRSPSPSSRKSLQNSPAKANKDHRTRVSQESPKSTKSLNAAAIPNVEVPSLERKGTIASTKSKRPLSAILGRSKSYNNGDPAVPSLPKSFSTDRLPVADQDTDQPEMPVLFIQEHLHAPGFETPRKKDELWGNFRTLDGEHAKFVSKPGTLKANIIRSSLLPFLKTYSDHPSNKSLRAEDLDRRVNILNKWWTGLLEMLNGRNGQSVSGNDRPAVLDGLTGIMTRPEWRLPASAISVRVDKARPPIKSASAISFDSTSSDFLSESVIHNVKNIFVQNLLSQMAFIVDRMSLRSVPASVVSFCGKASAYAFLFCPGVAEILVRLWSLPQGTIRRVLNEADIPRNANTQDAADSSARFFPSHLKHLAFTSLPKLMKGLRGRSPQSLSLDYIPWYGPWVARWNGRDSDLFFSFSKNYHILLCDLLPEDATIRERICAPCAVLIQAQMLAIMDATIHRNPQISSSEPVDGPLPTTFDDVLGAEASANPLPIRAPNSARLMAENRLIMLLREFLSESFVVREITRKTFAGIFGNLLKAATRRTSVYDHNACFALCDFLEESISILARFFRDEADPGSFLDWEFWFGALKQMGESNNTMTEVRLFAFVYSLWGFITKNDGRKSDVCLNWLLEEDFAYRQFNHWCPMVRAYYMRLLCWRVARFDGEGSETQFNIFNNVSTSLRTIWCHFLYIQSEAEKNGKAPQSTAPCTPAPGRRLVIIRDDSVPSPGTGMLLPFENVVAASSQSTAYPKISSLDTLKQASPTSENASVRSSSPVKKRWTMLRNMNPFSSTPSPPSTPTSTEHKAKALPTQFQSVSSPTSEHAQTLEQSRGRPSPPSSPIHSHRSFKFSLEWLDNAAMPLKDRKLNPPKLPHTSQSFLQTRRPEPITFEPLKPPPSKVTASKYVGRSLAEWAILVSECQNFYERRRSEGVPGIRWMETPTLGVESIRKPSG